MKKFALYLTALLFSVAVQATDANSFYTKGNKEYENGKYPEAVLSYTEALKFRKTPELYYNLGNAYYKTNQLGQAILHFEKALLLKPDFEQARENLSLCNSRIVDKIDNSARKNLSSFWFSIRQETGVPVFGAMTLISWILSAALFAVFIVSSGSALKKIGFFSGSFFLLVSFFLLYLTLSTQSELQNNKWAIVTTDKVDALTEPNTKSQITFVIHEGTKVHVNSRNGNWMEIQLENGGVGWVDKDSCTEI